MIAKSIGCFRTTSRMLCMACDPEFSPLRRRFQRLEELYFAVLDPWKLSPEELAVERAHREAVERYHFTYVDPTTGGKIPTRYYWFLKGHCCGEACRHCTFNLDGVHPSLRKKKKFNSAFWVDISQGFNDLKADSVGDLVKVKPKELKTISRSGTSVWYLELEK